MKIERSRLGFGLSGIAGSGNFSYQEKLVKTAINCGITHFDVAPYYGSGDAEAILGNILSTCNEKVTITTKFGLVPFKAGKAGSFLRSVGRPVFRRMRLLKQLTSTLIATIHKPGADVTFDKGSLLLSIDDSIKKLGRNIDIFLMHDPSLDLAQNPQLLEELDEARKSGRTSLTGITGSAENLVKILKTDPAVYPVAQLENSLTIVAPILQLSNMGADVITHRAIQGGIKQLKYLVDRRPGFKQVWLREFKIDPTVSENLAQVLIELALAENPGGTVLFSTTNSDRIKKLSTILMSPVLGEDGCKKLRDIFNEVYLKNINIRAGNNHTLVQ